MNIAFQAFLLLLFYLPGALFLWAIFGKLSSEKELPIISSSLSGPAALALLLAGALNAFWLLVIKLLDSHDIIHGVDSSEYYFVFLSGDQKLDPYNKASNLIGKNLWPMFCYFSSLFLFAAGLGSLINWTITYFKIDHHLGIFRFKPYWYYVLSGAFADEPGSIVWVDLLVEIGKTTVVYSGIVEDYSFIQATGDLDTIWLIGAERTCVDLCSDKRLSDKNEEKPTPVINLPIGIPGNLFSIKMTSVSNINVVYISLPDLKLLERENERQQS